MSLNLVVCGFLGSGKTTLIRRMAEGALAGRRVVVVENEWGSESVDGAYLRGGGLRVVDLRAGCVCCTLRGELAATMERLEAEYEPECVVVEPSGLGDLADLLRIPGFRVDGVAMLVDVERFDLLLKMNRDYYERQFRLAPVIVMTHTDRAAALAARVRGELERINPQALVVESTQRLDARWWLTTVTGCYAAFRALFPVVPERGPQFVAETFAVGRRVGEESFGALFARLAKRGLQPVRAKGCLRGDAGWMKADWLAPGRVGWEPLAGEPGCGGFLTCWWVDDGAARVRVETAREVLNEWNDGDE